MAGSDGPPTDRGGPAESASFERPPQGAIRSDRLVIGLDLRFYGSGSSEPRLFEHPRLQGGRSRATDPVKDRPTPRGPPRGNTEFPWPLSSGGRNLRSARAPENLFTARLRRHQRAETRGRSRHSEKASAARAAPETQAAERAGHGRRPRAAPRLVPPPGAVEIPLIFRQPTPVLYAQQEICPHLVEYGMMTSGPAEV